MTRRCRPLLLVAAIAGAMLLTSLIARWPGHVSPVFHEITDTVRLTNCDADVLAVGLTSPGDHLFQLVLGLDDLPYKSDLAKAPSRFAGRVRIFQEKAEVLSFPISSETAEPCNWLSHGPGICALLLSWNLPRDKDLDDVMVPGQRYTIQLEYDVAPASATSLWFSWVQEPAAKYDLAVVREPIRHRVLTTVPAQVTGPAGE
jgi:hypothetical protein